MSVAVAVLPISRWETRPSFKSVGLVCTCGKAVATFEGYARACDGCGAVYLVTVMILKAGEPHAGNNTPAPPAFADGPVADHPEPVTAERVIVRAQTHRLDGDAVPYTHGSDVKSPGAV